MIIHGLRDGTPGAPTNIIDRRRTSGAARRPRERRGGECRGGALMERGPCRMLDAGGSPPPRLIYYRSII